MERRCRRNSRKRCIVSFFHTCAGHTGEYSESSTVLAYRGSLGGLHGAPRAPRHAAGPSKEGTALQGAAEGSAVTAAHRVVLVGHEAVAAVVDRERVVPSKRRIPEYSLWQSMCGYLPPPALLLAHARANPRAQRTRTPTHMRPRVEARKHARTTVRPHAPTRAAVPRTRAHVRAWRTRVCVRRAQRGVRRGRTASYRRSCLSGFPGSTSARLRTRVKARIAHGSLHALTTRLPP